MVKMVKNFPKKLEKVCRIMKDQLIVYVTPMLEEIFGVPILHQILIYFGAQALF